MDVVWRRSAVNDLEAIQQFIAEENPGAAARVYLRIRAATSRLADYPDLGRAGRVDRTRELVLGGLPYIVVYRIVDRQVRILAIVDTSRRWPRYF